MRRNILVALFSVGISAPALAQDAVIEWNNVLLDAIREDRTAPPTAARAMAMTHIAIYDAVNAIDAGHEPYHFDGDAPDGASIDAAVAAAAHRVLLSIFPAQQDFLDAALDAALAEIPDGAAKTAGIELGEMAADDIIALRADDGSTDVVEYMPDDAPGSWEPTPPGFAPAALPHWAHVTPFAMTSGSQFRRGGPPALTSAEYTEAFNDVKLLGRAENSTRTQDQSEIAEFWVNGPGTATPPGHWNIIAQVVAEAQGNTLVENARLFALMNIALADAAICSWDNKYTYNEWRPVTAIRNADLDGNPDTEADTEWSSYIPTPPFPDYTSGHSTFSAAASKVLELFFGTDDVAFTTNSDQTPEVMRSYTSFSHAADESGRSRIYGGIHWEHANQDGLGSGRDLGAYVFANYLKAIDDNGSGPGRPRFCGILGGGQMALMLAGLAAMRFSSHRRRKL
jgi:hypothetical protein